ncbi:Hypothetical predicted protein [Paramuricea clavata]|uniref:Uncharacterized protein n=1 Tax=Paramuricea clavata TaxID=317549 RepID=A0A6S7GEF7_PARCT|nr:Hypothetical predicted protein [Paramuricea clavata]
MYKTLLARSHFRPVFQTEQSYGSHLPQSQPAIRHDDDSLQYNASQSEYTSVSENEKSVYENDNPGNNGRAETCEEESLRENAYYNLVQARREERNTYHYMCSNQYKITVSNEIMEKIRRFNSGPDDFLKVFETTHDEIRTDEEAFIINDLLRKSDSPNSQIMDGKLDHLAMLACCNSPHVVKRALDALLNEIFLSISDYSRIRCFNILKAENIFRASFLKFVKVDHFKAKSHRMTTYAWLITLVLLKCSKEECIEIQPKIKEFDKTLDALQSDKEHSSRNTFRFGIYLARESIKRIIQHCGKKNFRESLNSNLKKCENVLNSKLEKNEVMKLGRAINDGGNWLDLHVCLVFLQDLPKVISLSNGLYKFTLNPLPKNISTSNR